MGANEEANHAGRSSVGTGEILTALLLENGGKARAVLSRFEITAAMVRDELSNIAPVVDGNLFVLGQIPVSEEVNRAIVMAAGEADRVQCRTIDTGHILLGLMGESNSIAAHVLEKLGVGYNSVLLALLEASEHDDQDMDMGKPPNAQVNCRLGEDAARVLIEAANEAMRLSHHQVGTEHVLLGLCLMENGPVAGILDAMGIDHDRIEHELLHVLPRGQDPEKEQIPESSGSFKELVQTAAQKACELNQNLIRPEHLVIAMLDNPTDELTKVLRGLHLDRDELARAVYERV